ncbi:MAG: alpha/beta fold hydrolase [Pirellulales bacterium]|nr:alpha/beta fold hydrolase [Pirellulales bacterium]
MKSRTWLCAALLLALQTAAGAAEPVRSTGPWNLEALQQPPQATWGQTVGSVQEVYYENEPRGGQPTRVFAYYARPAEGAGPFPAMVLVHGGGGKAFAEWAELWARRGYAALAMDLAGRGPDGMPLADGGPDQDGASKIRNFTAAELRDLWSYYAVAAVIRGHSLLASRPEVDPRRIGITGISWGGYLTSIVAGLDDRLAVAVPVYGCGFLRDNSAWVDEFKALEPAAAELWDANYDPRQYLGGVGCPILWVNGTNDFAYPLDSYQKSYRLTPATRQLCVRVRMPHSHPDGWAPAEIGLFVDSVLTGGAPLPRVGEMIVREGRATAAVVSTVPLKLAELHYTTDAGPWQMRNWQSQPAALRDGQIEAELPPARPLVCYLSVTDERGALVSAEHVVLEAP